jgi:prepilin-type N-terminal cleavage/methylation domain-containing protein/prepilin-type processing-associated H-X9-DG protein
MSYIENRQAMSKRCSDKGSRCGFTLIELLVVIAIIAILAAILFPVFARARENARRSACMSNLKQLGLGVLQYAQDYDEKFPVYRTVGQEGWALGIQPYIKSWQLFYCPSVSGNYNGSANIVHYSYNIFVGGYKPGSTPPFVGVGLAEMDRSALTVVLMDSFEAYGNNAEGGCQPDVNCAATPAGLAVFANGASSATVRGSGSSTRHLDGQNFAFADGHAKWYKGTTNGKSTAVYNWITPFSVSGNNPTFNYSKQ